MNENWLKERAEFERQLINAKQTVMKYEGTLKPYRTVTDSEYEQAKKDVIVLATRISNGNHEAGKPENPLDSMSLRELRDLYEEKKSEYRGGAGSARQASYLLTIDSRIQTLKAETGGNE